MSVLLPNLRTPPPDVSAPIVTSFGKTPVLRYQAKNTTHYYVSDLYRDQLPHRWNNLRVERERSSRLPGQQCHFRAASQRSWCHVCSNLSAGVSMTASTTAAQSIIAYSVERHSIESGHRYRTKIRCISCTSRSGLSPGPTGSVRHGCAARTSLFWSSSWPHSTPRQRRKVAVASIVTGRWPAAASAEI